MWHLLSLSFFYPFLLIPFHPSLSSLFPFLLIPFPPYSLSSFPFLLILFPLPLFYLLPSLSFYPYLSLSILFPYYFFLLLSFHLPPCPFFHLFPSILTFLSFYSLLSSSPSFSLLPSLSFCFFSSLLPTWSVVQEPKLVYETFAHVLEIFDFDPSTTTQDLQQVGCPTLTPSSQWARTTKNTD